MPTKKIHGSSEPSRSLGVENVTLTPSVCISLTSDAITGFGPLTVNCCACLSACR